MKKIMTSTIVNTTNTNMATMVAMRHVGIAGTPAMQMVTAIVAVNKLNQQK